MTAGAAQPLTFEKVPVKGSCGAFNLHRENRGIMDEDGVTHPRLAGWTNVNASYRTSTRYTTTRERGRFRVKAEVRGTFTGTAVPTRLDWVPTYRLSEACEREKARWERQVEAHEARHVADFLRIMKTAGAQWRNGWTLETTGATAAQARAELERKVKDAFNAELKRIMGESERASNAFHASPQGRPIGDIDCGVCRER